ncbi:MAG: DUF3604 domain-containing protein [Acidobacteria bacterium]|nr:DUF3604 domain-containing protein [Acidobacteriota bacterium]
MLLPNPARFALLAFAVSSLSCAAPSARDTGGAPYPGSADVPPASPAYRVALFGDMHIHTMYSHDAFMGTVRTTPDDAYRYARGEAIPHPSGESIRLSGAPLDFLAVTDHAEYLGALAALIDPSSPTYGHPLTEDLFSGEGRDARARLGALSRLRELGRAGDPINGPEVRASAWQRVIEAAERHNDPGRFTALIGYEYTMGVGGRHVHRNVIFRGSEAPELPFSSLDGDPEDLWNWLDNLREEGIEALAMPHNMNQSDGLAFPDRETWKGAEIDAEFAAKRIRNEPVAEISQQKGTSEVHPSLSPNDEWADFQIVQYYLDRVNNTDPISIFKGGYWRDALLTGLEMEERLGVNPYALGAVGSSDSHVSAGSYEEDNRFSSRTNTPQARGSAYREEDGGWENFWTPRTATHGTGGLAGVWADTNTRAAIFDALTRRESFATSGTRIRVRFFGGFGLEDAIAGAADQVAAAYEHGVPMGGDLSASESRTLGAPASSPASGNAAAPSFLVWALRDPENAWLQRAQVVKGWLEDGEAKEQVYDVVCSDGLPDPETHRCDDNGAQVNLDDCSISRDKGAVELRTTWTDPDFDPGARSFYYVRVLENPTCRWSTWDALSLGIEPNPDLHATHQERAWSSPIWYTP